MHRLSRITTILFSAIFIFAMPFSILAQDNLKSQVLDPLGQTTDAAGYDRAISITAAIGNLTKAFLAVFGAYFLFRTVYAGYLWFMAKGNEEQVQQAKEILKGAVFGVIVASMAGVIIALVTNLVA